jgi:hypothetical protein
MGSIGDLSGFGNPSNPNLPRIRPEQRLTPAFMAGIVNGVDRSTLRNGTGYTVTNYPNGQVLNIPPWVKTGEGFNLQVTAFVDKDQPFATVSLGTVNRVIPTINSKHLDQYTDGVPPRLPIPAPNGFVVLEVTYEANKPFPSKAEIKFMADRPDTSNETTTSRFILATTEFKAKTKTEEASVFATQVHKRGNLIVNRFKVGASLYYWFWYTI